jgi:hypothetical protein
MPQTSTPQNAPKLLHIFKPGRWTTMAGEAIEFSQADLQASAAAYDPRVSKAPIVIGHPTTDAPAKGWAMAAIATERGLFVTPEKVDAAFAEEVKAGRWGAVSVKFYRPTEPTNPVPGSWYIRHVGFLGAANPAVKGLDDPAFANTADDGCACFVQAVALSEYDDVTNAALWRNLREHLIGTVGQDKADAVIPGYMVASLEQAAQDEVREAAAEGADTPTPAFSELNPKEKPVTPEEKAALEAENTRLRGELAANKAAQIHAANVAFCEGQAGVLPAWRAVAVATLDHLAAQPEVVQFGEGDAIAPLADQLKAMLAALPAAVQFGESATKARAATAGDTSASFAAPQGFTANPAALSQHARALAYQKAHGGSFKDAALAVSERN